MKTPRTLLFSALLLSFSLGASAAPLSKVDYKAAKSDIENKYNVAKAELEANYEPSAKHSLAVHTAKAKAALAIAKEKCDDQAGNAKAVCRKEAEALYTSDMAKAKLSEKTGEINNKAAEEIKGTR